MDWFTIRTMSHGALSCVPFIYFPFIFSKSTSFWCLLAIFCCQAKRKEVNFESFLFKSEESTSHGHVRGDSKSPFFPSNLKLCHSNPTFNPESSVTQDLWCSLIHSYLVCIAAWPMLRFMIKELLNPYPSPQYTVFCMTENIHFFLIFQNWSFSRLWEIVRSS